MSDEIINTLRALANRWALKARDLARDAKAETADAETASYNRGLADGYYRAAMEMAEVLKTQPTAPSRPAPPPMASPQKPDPNAGGRWSASSSVRPDAPPPPKPPTAANATSTASGSIATGGSANAAAQYKALEIGEVLRILQYAGTAPRDVQIRSDWSYHAIFSRWENLTPSERLDRIKKADFRIVVLESGISKDSRDPFIDFAFIES